MKEGRCGFCDSNALCFVLIVSIILIQLFLSLLRISIWISAGASELANGLNEFSYRIRSECLLIQTL
jgi:uncharacterized protein YqfA (UPF0365 family)